MNIINENWDKITMVNAYFSTRIHDGVFATADI